MPTYYFASRCSASARRSCIGQLSACSLTGVVSEGMLQQLPWAMTVQAALPPLRSPGSLYAETLRRQRITARCCFRRSLSTLRPAQSYRKHSLSAAALARSHVRTFSALADALSAPCKRLACPAVP